MDKYENKHDYGKIQLDLISPEFIEDLGKVLTFGANKYSAESWKTVPDAENRYYAALLRHIMAYRKGEDMDEESGLSHLAHASACLMFITHFEKERKNGRIRKHSRRASKDMLIGGLSDGTSRSQGSD